MENVARVRLAKTDERRGLEELQRRASLTNPGDRDALLAHPDAVHLAAGPIEQGRVLVLEEGDATLGFAVLFAPRDGVAELDGLFVEPSHWRSGYGRTLLTKCLAMARREGAMEVHVVANPHALAFYAACGFVAIRSHDTRFGPAVAMSLRV